MNRYIKDTGYGDLKPCQLIKINGWSRQKARRISNGTQSLSHKDEISLQVGMFNKGNRYNNLDQIRDMALLKQNMRITLKILIFEELTTAVLAKRLEISRNTARQFIKRQKNPYKKSNIGKFHKAGIYFEYEIPYLNMLDQFYNSNLNYAIQRYVFKEKKYGT